MHKKYIFDYYEEKYNLQSNKFHIDLKDSLIPENGSFSTKMLLEVCYDVLPDNVKIFIYLKIVLNKDNELLIDIIRFLVGVNDILLNFKQMFVHLKG